MSESEYLDGLRKLLEMQLKRRLITPRPTPLPDTYEQVFRRALKQRVGRR